MDWLAGLAFIFAIYVIFLLIRRKQTPAPAVEPHESRVVKSLRSFEGRECIYTDGRRALKSQVQQISMAGDQIWITLQPLRTEGLSEINEPTIRLSEAARSIEHLADLVQAPYANWRLYFGRELIHHVSVIARKGADMKVIQRTILDFDVDSEHRPQV